MEQPQLELPDSQPIFPEIEYEETNFTNNIIHYDVEVVESEKEEKDPNPPRVRPVARPLAAEFDASGNPGGCEVQDVGDEDDVEIVSATEGSHANTERLQQELERMQHLLQEAESLEAELRSLRQDLHQNNFFFLFLVLI